MNRPFSGRRFAVEVFDHNDHEYEVIRGPAAAAVVARTPSGELILIEQYRPAVGRSLLELPAGLIDASDADPMAAARRELLEETGFDCDSLAPLGDGFFSTAGMADERFYLFEARAGAAPVGDTDGEADQVILLPFAEALERARSGDLEDAKTCLGILLASGE